MANVVVKILLIERCLADTMCMTLHLDSDNLSADDQTIPKWLSGMTVNIMADMRRMWLQLCSVFAARCDA